MSTAKTAPRVAVCQDTRRVVWMLAKARTPSEVVKEGHEAFVRHELKKRLGIGASEPAPDAFKKAAAEIAAVLVARDVAAKDAAIAKAAAEAAAVT